MVRECKWVAADEVSQSNERLNAQITLCCILKIRFYYHKNVKIWSPTFIISSTHQTAWLLSFHWASVHVQRKSPQLFPKFERLLKIMLSCWEDNDSSAHIPPNLFPTEYAPSVYEQKYQVCLDHCPHSQDTTFELVIVRQLKSLCDAIMTTMHLWFLAVITVWCKHKL